MRPPVFLSFWILTILAWFGALWILTSAWPGGEYANYLGATILVWVVAFVLRESYTQDPPHRF